MSHPKIAFFPRQSVGIKITSSAVHWTAPVFSRVVETDNLEGLPEKA